VIGMAEALSVQGLWAGYNGGIVLKDTALRIEPGQVLALLGRNGAGKTTLCSTIMGMVKPYQGSVRIYGREMAGARPDLVARAGVAIVPQGRRIFGQLTVLRNLTIAAPRQGSGPWTLERVFTLLPSLAVRSHYRADQLSGGEQQMLAIGRALLQNPRLILLDEPSAGLAPAMVDRMIDVIRSLSRQELSVLLVEHDLHTAFAVADEVAVMQHGAIVHRATTQEFRHDGRRAAELLRAP
jgi:branched-chain amino acid transport system ATP-binding protein